MLEMTPEAMIVVADYADEKPPTIGQKMFYHVTMTECSKCYSLQPCISDATTYRCADWNACRARQQENKEEMPVALTIADQVALLERMEIMQADMERLKRIESAAMVFAQASEAFDNAPYNTHMVTLMMDREVAASKLIEAVSMVRFK